MKREARGARSAGHGPSQRQLRAGELVRHSLADILRHGDLHDAALETASVTVTEVRMSPDLRHAVCFVVPLGGVHADEVIEALNRHARFLRGRLGREIDMKFTPELRFLRDQSFEEAARMDALLNSPAVRRDVVSPASGGDGDGGEAADPPSSVSGLLPPEGEDRR